MADPNTRDAPAEDAGGMIDLDAYAEIKAKEDAERAAEEAARNPDALPAVTDERLREMKDKARKMIEERLKAKRKQRRLMRGGDMP